MADNPSQDTKNRLPKKDVGGRYLSAYDPDIALQVVEAIAAGGTLNSILRGVEGMPHPTTFQRWMVNHPELARAFDAALRISASSFEEEALDTARAIARNPKDGTHVRAAEVKIGQLRWSAERRDPAKFGQKSQVNIKVPIQIITPLDLGGSSSESIPDIYTLDAKQIRTVEVGPKSPPLVEEKPIQIGGRRKVTLTPASGKPVTTPFSKVLRGIEDENANVRPKSHRPSHRHQQAGVGGEGFHAKDGEAGVSASKGESNSEETPKGGV